MQSKFHHKLKSRTVQDLYWLLFSYSPLSDDYNLSPYSLFPREILDEWLLTSSDYFLDLDQNHKEIENFIKRKKNKRLGFYSEALLSYFFQTFSPIELVLQNFQIIENKRTIGEIDFIIRYNNKVIHIECAVKYYLLIDSKLKDEASQWVGPRLKDNLELKINKIIRHQLPLGKRVEIQEKIGCPPDFSCLFLKGVFFTEKEILPGKINRNQPHLFIRLSDLHNFSIKPVKILDRPNWLSSMNINALKHTTDFVNFKESLTNPEMVLFDDRKVRFIVPNNWGKTRLEVKTQ